MINQYMRRIFEEVDFGNIYIFGKASNLLEEMIGGLGELDLRPSRLGARRSCKVNDLADGNYGYMSFNLNIESYIRYEQEEVIGLDELKQLIVDCEEKHEVVHKRFEEWVEKLLK